MYLKKNVGPINQIIRITLGILLILAAVTFQWAPIIAILAGIGAEQRFSKDLLLTDWFLTYWGGLLWIKKK